MLQRDCSYRSKAGTSRWSVAGVRVCDSGTSLGDWVFLRLLSMVGYGSRSSHSPVSAEGLRVQFGLV